MAAPDRIFPCGSVVGGTFRPRAPFRHGTVPRYRIGARRNPLHSRSLRGRMAGPVPVKAPIEPRRYGTQGIRRLRPGENLVKVRARDADSRVPGRFPSLWRLACFARFSISSASAVPLGSHGWSARRAREPSARMDRRSDFIPWNSYTPQRVPMVSGGSFPIILVSWNPTRGTFVRISRTRPRRTVIGMRFSVCSVPVVRDRHPTVLDGELFRHLTRFRVPIPMRMPSCRSLPQDIGAARPPGRATPVPCRPGVFPGKWESGA